MNVSRGFTLIEVVVGMVVFAIVMFAAVALFVEQSRISIEPLWQTRGATLGESLLAEIMAQPFDENAGTLGQGSRCNEGTDCTYSSSLGPDAGESRGTFDDVDDYHLLSQVNGGITDSLGNPLIIDGHPVYQGFQVQVLVHYDDNMDGVDDDDLNGDGLYDTGAYHGNMKRVLVVVTTPSGERIALSGYRGNLQ